MAVVLAVFGATGGHAQSVVRGELEGSVTDVGGGTLGGVQITVTEVQSRLSVLTESNDVGAFEVPFLEPGLYEVLVEERGFIPRLVRDVDIRDGRIVRIEVELAPSPPPVTSVDTVSAGESIQPSLDGLGSRWVSAEEIQAFPDPHMDLSGLAALSSSLDPAMGSEGLPGAATTVMLDGLPFTPARHPHQPGWSSVPILPRIGLANLDLNYRPDVEWFGGAGTTVALTSRSAGADPGAEVFASGSSGGLWQSESFSQLSKPAATSAWGGGAFQLPLGNDQGRLFVGVEGLRVQTPEVSPVAAEFAGRLVASSPSLTEADAERLVEPWLSTLQGVSALSRLDWETQGSTEITVRGGFSSIRDEGSHFFAQPLTYGMPAAFSGTDVFVAASAMAELSPRWALELKGGFEWSDRTWEGTEGPGTADGLTPTYLLADGALLGPDPGLEGGVTRSAFVGVATAHARWGRNWFKLGASASVPSYDYTYAYASAGEYVLSEPESVFLGDGAYRQTGGTVRPATFTVPELGAFAQYRWEPEEGIQITTGLRLDYEILPDGAAPFNAAWMRLTGLANNAFEPGLSKVSPRVSVSWDLSGDGNTVLDAATSATYGQLDPSALNEVYTLSGALSDDRQVGGLGQWPDRPTESGDASASGTALAVFGPKLEAPRTERATLGVSQLMGRAALQVSATFRRTEFLLRRSELNLTVAPSGTLSDGRPVYGTLRKAGSLVLSEPGSSRRFSEFGSVWALNADGWSEYVGLTAAIEYQASESLDVFASYTFSSTDDNLVGSRSTLPEAQLPPNLGPSSPDDWTEGTSDFDVPHRLTAGFRAHFRLLEGLEASGLYRFQSGWPYTPGYRIGVDVNADGSTLNDPAFVPTDVSSVQGDTACLNNDLGKLATRNACRGPSSYSADLHLKAGLVRLGTSVLSLTFDAFNLADSDLGSPDTALALVDDSGALTQSPGTSETTIPLLLNPRFGEIQRSLRPGRMFRFGLQLGAP